jgi:hypothetical protein
LERKTPMTEAQMMELVSRDMAKKLAGCTIFVPTPATKQPKNNAGADNETTGKSATVR